MNQREQKLFDLLMVIKPDVEIYVPANDLGLNKWTLMQVACVYEDDTAQVYLNDDYYNVSLKEVEEWRRLWILMKLKEPQIPT